MDVTKCRAQESQLILALTSQKHADIILAPLKPHFYIVKRGLHGYKIFFLCLLKTKIVGIRSNRLVVAVLVSTDNLCFEQKYEKYQAFYLKIFNFW